MNQHKARFGPTRSQNPWDFHTTHEKFLGLFNPIEFPTTFFARGNPYTMSGRFEPNNYIGIQRYYFIAPKTGTFEFLYSSDDWGTSFRIHKNGRRARMHKNDGADNPWNFETSQSRMSYDIDLEEGEEIQIEAAYKQGPNGPSHRKFSNFYS